MILSVYGAKKQEDERLKYIFIEMLLVQQVYYNFHNGNKIPTKFNELSQQEIQTYHKKLVAERDLLLPRISKNELERVVAEANREVEKEIGLISQVLPHTFRDADMDPANDCFPKYNGWKK